MSRRHPNAAGINRDTKTYAIPPDATAAQHKRMLKRTQRALQAALLRSISGGIEVKDDGHPFFRTQKRAAFSVNTLCQTMNAIYKRAGIEGATSHSGRRSFITRLASKAVGVRVLASLAGHRSIATT